MLLSILIARHVEKKRPPTDQVAYTVPLVDRKERNEHAARSAASARERKRRVRSFIQTDAHFAKGAFNLHSGGARGRRIIHLAASEARSGVAFCSISETEALFNYSGRTSAFNSYKQTRLRQALPFPARLLFQINDYSLFPLDDCQIFLVNTHPFLLQDL
jgi:hypothetical protein